MRPSIASIKKFDRCNAYRCNAYPCHLIIDYLKTQEIHLNQLEHLKKQMYNSRVCLNMAKYEADKIYEAIGIDIDMKAESLINLIHE